MRISIALIFLALVGCGPGPQIRHEPDYFDKPATYYRAPTYHAPTYNAPSYKPFYAENGSHYGELNQFGVPKTVYVKPYIKKDGTYVEGHYRGLPRR